MNTRASDRSGSSCGSNRAHKQAPRGTRRRAAPVWRPERLEPRTLLAFTPVGPEFVVNATTAGKQLYPEVASDAAGDSVVVWYGDGASGLGVYARQFDAAGAPMGGELFVTSVPVNSIVFPKVWMDVDGDFVVEWGAGDGSGWGVFARHYGADGAAEGPTFRVNTTTAGDQGGATAVGFGADGGFVITWASSAPGSRFADLYAQRYSAAGVPLGGEVRIPTDPAGYIGEASVAFDAGGGFVVAWQEQDAIYARRYDAASVPQGEKVFVNDDGTGRPMLAVSSDAAGNFAVVWQTTDEDGFGIGIYGRYFNAAAVPRGETFRVDTHAVRRQARPAVASAAEGGFVVAWDSGTVVARRYDSAGLPLGAEFNVNSPSNPGSDPSIAADADGDVVVAWNSFDDSGYGIRARRFAQSDLPLAVRVVGVSVNGPGLTGQTTQEGETFQGWARIDDAGYPVPAGANQLKSIPWIGGVDRIAIRFDEDVSAFLGKDDLVVHGVNTPDYAITDFRYDLPTRTGVWTLAAPVTSDRLTLVLDAAGVAGLDGEWPGGAAGNFPSGDGSVGGDLRFGVNVLAGDANGDGRVNALDLAFIRTKLNRTVLNQGSGYSPFADLNADGFINALDLAAAKARLNRQLPPLDPLRRSCLATVVSE